MRTRSAVALVTAIALVVAGNLAAHAGIPVPLDERVLLTVQGARDKDRLGHAVAAAGDVNGDGLADVIVAAEPWDESSTAFAFVIFGSSGEDGSSAATSLSAGSLGQRGFAIERAGTSRSARRVQVSVAAAGDLDGDGLDDVLVSDPAADPLGSEDAGSVYIVFGRAGTETVDLATDPRVVEISGAEAGEGAGSAVAPAGDVDTDGIPDIAIGAPYGSSGTGRAYVVYGRRLGSDLDLALLGTDGYVIHGPRDRKRFGWSVAGAGDMNGDGSDDLVIGAPGTSYQVRGQVYVVYGSGEPLPISADELGSRGWRVEGLEQGDEAGWAVASGSDFDGDGVPDVAIGAPGAEDERDYPTGQAFVVSGGTYVDGVFLSAPDARVTQIQGAPWHAELGRDLAFIPDGDGDGRSELVVGAPQASPYDLHGAGTVHVVPGSLAGATFELNDDSDVGLDLENQDSFEGAGYALASLPGQRIIVGAPDADVNGRSMSGLVYIVDSSPAASTPPPNAVFISYRAPQEAGPGTYCWDGVCEERAASFPPPADAGAGDEAIVRPLTRVPPDSLTVTAYRSLDEAGVPVGDGQDLPVSIRPRRSGDAIVGYEGWFRLPDVRGAVYLVARGDWSEGQPGNVTWFGHFVLGEPRGASMDGPPESVLRSRGTRQIGRQGSYCWSRSFPDGTGVGQCVDTFGGARPGSKRAHAGAKARIRFKADIRPKRLVILAYRRVDDRGIPKGKVRRLPYRWRAHRRDGEVVAQDAIFRLPHRTGNLFLDARANWPQGGLTYDFRLRLR